MSAPASPGESCFLDIAARRAAERPDDPIFRLAGGAGAVTLDNAGLVRRVRALGEALAAAGYAAGGHVAICMENRPAWPVAYLATWYADGVTVPIDPALEAHAIRRVLDHARHGVVLTSARLGAKVAAACEGLDAPPAVYDVDACGDRRWDGDSEGAGVPAVAASVALPAWEALGAEARTSGPWRPRPARAQAGTIMYTSGTTGTPKGVVLSRRALLLNITAGLRRVQITPDTHVLGVLPLFHALPLMANCLGPLCVGARVTFLDELNPDRIIAAFREHGITTFACVPLFYYRFHDRVMKRLAQLPPARRRAARMLLWLSRAGRRMGMNLGRRLFAAAHEPFGPQLELFITGGARFDPEVYERFLDLGFTLVQGYGLTEATAVLTAHPRDQLRGDTVGTPVDGVEIRIDRPGPDGVGEIVARTPSRMLGYYRNPEATAEVFDGEWLRTGDLGRLLPNGHLQVTGRVKDVIVLASGKNIYPEELEAYYGRSALVEEICILGIPDPERRGAERLHAVVVPDMDELRRRGLVNAREMVKWELESLGLQLPSPQRITSLELRTEPLPRTTTRKVKRYALRQEILQRGAGAVHARGAEESRREPDDVTAEPEWAHAVRAILARHARMEGVRRDQHLDLDLGLESLDRIEVHAEIEETLSVELPQDAAGQVQTVGDLLELVGRHVQPDRGGSIAAADRWERVLAEPPPEIDAYLQRRPLAEALLRVLFSVGRGAVRLSGFRVAGLEHLPPEPPFIIAPNHLSYVDPFLLAMALPRPIWERIFFVGYSAYFEGRLLGGVSRLLRTVPIDQNRHLERAMQAAAEGLRRDMVLGIFPEGARSGDGSVKEFRRGTAILARLLQVPVVPVGIWGTYEMWPREGRPRPHPVGIVFGEPMRSASTGGRATEEAFTAQLRERVIELVGAARRLVTEPRG